MSVIKKASKRFDSSTLGKYHPKSTTLTGPRIVFPLCEQLSVSDKRILAENLRKVELLAWKEDQAFQVDQLLSHMETFPRGMLLYYESQCYQDKLEPQAWILVEILKYDVDNPIPSWYLATDNGYLLNSHDENGDWLFGVNLSVPPKVQFGVARKLLDAVKDLVVERNLKGLVFGSRIPRYHKHKDQMSVMEYALSRRGTRPLDPELARYESYGFQFYRNKLESVVILPEYFEDSDSGNFGVLFAWMNSNIEVDSRNVAQANS